MATYKSIALGVILLVCCAELGSGVDYTVGDSAGWTVGIDYSTWTAGKTFVVGDTLVFNYAGCAHTVSEVSESDYSTCSTGNAIGSHGSGTTAVALSTAGTRYFICGIPGHCAAGMKLSVAVVSGSIPSQPSSGSGCRTTPATATPTSTVPYSAGTGTGTDTVTGMYFSGAAGSLSPVSATVIGAIIGIITLCYY